MSNNNTVVVPVLGCPNVPVIALADLLLHEHRKTTNQVRRQLTHSLKMLGYCFLTSPKRGQNRASRILDQLRRSVHTAIFPTEASAEDRLETSDTVYVSERGVPMYRLGYEHSEDRIRQVFRMAGGDPDAVRFPSSDCRNLWMRGLGLLRHICDTGLDLLLQSVEPNNDDNHHHAPGSHGPPSSWWSRSGSKRPGSGSSAWNHRSNPELWKEPFLKPDRSGDFSVLYIMHYFNSGAHVDVDGRGHAIAVRPHVDPSLLVLEPFLCQHTTGLQVWDRRASRWLDCDGPRSPVAHLWDEHEVLLLFVGRALATTCRMEPTLHRVVSANRPRRTVIYEQKYEEFFPPPRLD
jgi:hypothetical protein